MTVVPCRWADNVFQLCSCVHTRFLVLYCFLLYLSVHVTCSMYLLWNTVHCIVAVCGFSFLVTPDTSDVRSRSVRLRILLMCMLRCA